MDFDDFKRMQGKLHRERFEKFKEAFDKESVSKGGKTFDQLFPDSDSKDDRDPRADQVKEIIGELISTTTDEDPGDALVRALVTYRALVRHVKDGGTVKFTGIEGQADRVLKVRVKPPST